MLCIMSFGVRTPELWVDQGKLAQGLKQDCLLEDHQSCNVTRLCHLEMYICPRTITLSMLHVNSISKPLSGSCHHAKVKKCLCFQINSEVYIHSGQGLHYPRDDDQLLRGLWGYVPLCTSSTKRISVGSIR